MIIMKIGFYGKIGIFPFIEMVEARRSSRNCPSGTLEPKCINVTAETYQKMLRDKVFSRNQEEMART